VEKKFKILRFIGSVYKIVGAIIAVLTILGSIGICVTTFVGGAFMGRMQREFGVPMAQSTLAGIFAAGSALISGAVLALTLYASGEGIFLLLSLEENTRATALYLQQYQEE
jgi:hypothetical protein